MKRSPIAAIVLLLIIVPTMAIGEIPPWLGLLLGLAVVVWSVSVDWPYWRGKRALGISLLVAGFVLGGTAAYFLLR